MEYDDGSRRLNLLSGIVLGTLLGAGLALLLVPGEGPAEKARFVVRAARRVGAGARRTHAYARGLRAQLESAGDGGETEDLEPDDEADDLDAGGDAADDGRARASSRRRTRGMARRRFEL